MRVSVAYAAMNAGTAGIARAVKEALKGMGFDAEVCPVKDGDDLCAFDAIVLGSGVYIGKWPNEAVTFGARHNAELRQRPVWLFERRPIGSAAGLAEAEPASDGSTLTSIPWQV